MVQILAFQNLRFPCLLRVAWWASGNTRQRRKTGQQLCALQLTGIVKQNMTKMKMKMKEEPKNIWVSIALENDDFNHGGSVENATAASV